MSDNQTSQVILGKRIVLVSLVIVVIVVFAILRHGDTTFFSLVSWTNEVTIR